MNSTPRTPAASPSGPSITVTCYVPVADRATFPAAALADKLTALGEVGAAETARKIARRDPVDLGKHGEVYGREGRADSDLDGALADLARACGRHCDALGLGDTGFDDALDAEDFRVDVEDEDDGASATAHPAGEPGREVTVVAPDGTGHHFTVAGDDATLTVLVYGEPVLGIDQGGAGRWTGETWLRLALPAGFTSGHSSEVTAHLAGRGTGEAAALLAMDEATRCPDQGGGCAHGCGAVDGYRVTFDPDAGTWTVRPAGSQAR